MGDEIAEFVSATYMFDRIEIAAISAEHIVDGFTLTAPGLTVIGELGGPAPFDLGGLTPMEPSVRFGFCSAPATPQLVSVATTIDLPG